LTLDAFQGILFLNTFKSMPQPKATAKSEETGLKILNAALELFREQGFDRTTMREIAQKAEVATGAAYYYYASKDEIVMDFYRRAAAEMQPNLAAALAGAATLEARLRDVIRVKLDRFAPDRTILRALLRNGADPQHPLSPFSAETQAIRELDIEWFRRVLADCGTRVPRDLAPHLPGVLWLFQMGVILFWVIDDSPDQSRTTLLLDLASKIVANLIRFSALPLMRPLRKTALQLIEIVNGATL
jgi:AcrR family transcriptional regulator